MPKGLGTTDDDTGGAFGEDAADADDGLARGGFVTGPSRRLIGEAGAEHVLNVDSGPSVRALTEGLRPIIRELFEEERRSGVRQDIHLHMEGAIISDRRGLDWLARQLDDIRVGRRVAKRRFR